MSTESGAEAGSPGRPTRSAVDVPFDLLSRATSVAAALICAALILTTTFSVVVYQRGITISWLDDLLRLLLIWLVFLGSVAPVWRRDHITMDAVYARFGPRLRTLVDTLICVMGIAICGFLTWVSLATTAREYEHGTLLSSGELPAWPQTFSIPLSFALMTLAYVGVLIATLAGRAAPRAPGNLP